jgi:chromosome segregation ATPase
MQQLFQDTSNVDDLTRQRLNDSEAMVGEAPGPDVSMESFAQERDRRIQLEIKNLQIESVRIERGMKASFDKARNIILTSEEAEAGSSTTRIRLLAEQVSELTMKRETLVAACNRLKTEADDTTKAWAALAREVAVYEDGISVYIGKKREYELECNRLERQIAVSANMHGSQVGERLHQLKVAADELVRSCAEEQGAIEKNQSRLLAKLDSEVLWPNNMRRWCCQM